MLFVLSMTAGSADAIGFLGLNGLFIAHMTGNLVIVAAKLAVGAGTPVAHLLSLTIFIATLALTRLATAALERRRIAPLVSLLALQFALLVAFLGISLAAGPNPDPDAANMIVASMLGVTAMAVQNAVVQISLNGSPSTAVMTTNMTRFVMDLGDVMLLSDADGAGKRLRSTVWTITGFFGGCMIGAAGETALGLTSVALPAGLALVALALSVAPGLKQRRPRRSS